MIKGMTEKEYFKEYSKKYYQEHKEYFREHNKKWRDENPEKQKEMRQEYYQANKEKCNDFQKKWRNKNKSRWVELCGKSRTRRVERLRADGCTNAWCVVNNGAKPKYKEK